MHNIVGTIFSYIFFPNSREQTCADMVTNEELARGRLYPPLAKCRDVSLAIAVETVKEAYRESLATWHPCPYDIKKFISARMYDYDYDSFTPATYRWPSLPSEAPSE